MTSTQENIDREKSEVVVFKPKWGRTATYLVLITLPIFVLGNIALEMTSQGMIPFQYKRAIQVLYKYGFPSLLGLGIFVSIIGILKDKNKIESVSLLLVWMTSSYFCIAHQISTYKAISKGIYSLIPALSYLNSIGQTLLR